MSNITRVGVDLAKNLIQVHAVDAAGKVPSHQLRLPQADVSERRINHPGALVSERVIV